jgi:hypothetical protein
MMIFAFIHFNLPHTVFIRLWDISPRVCLCYANTSLRSLRQRKFLLLKESAKKAFSHSREYFRLGEKADWNFNNSWVNGILFDIWGFGLKGNFDEEFEMKNQKGKKFQSNQAFKFVNNWK